MKLFILVNIWKGGGAYLFSNDHHMTVVPFSLQSSFKANHLITSYFIDKFPVEKTKTMHLFKDIHQHITLSASVKVLIREKSCRVKCSC
jgi:hypothetical protein